LAQKVLLGLQTGGKRRGTDLRREEPILSKINNANGFTLIELMVVVAVIAIILAIAIPYYESYKRTACDRTAAADISKLGAAVERFGNQLIDSECSDMTSFVASMNLAYFVGPYYGWGGTSRKCNVMARKLDDTQEVQTCAVGGSRPVEQSRYIYRIRIVGGADLPIITGSCNPGDEWASYGGPGNNCYTSSMISPACTLITPGGVDCSEITGSM